MAKSIRSKSKKRFRAVKRSTIGEMQTRKILRKTLRRLQASLVAGPDARVDETGRIVVGSSISLSALKSVLAGTPVTAAGDTAIDVAAAASATTGALGGDMVIRGAAPVERKKRLRYTFNTALRAERIAAQVEDETDDEDDVRLGRLPRAAAPPPADDAMDPSVPQEAAVLMAADKTVRKRVNGPKYKDNFRDGGVGHFDSDPALARTNTAAHRKKKQQQHVSHAAAAAAATAEPAPAPAAPVDEVDAIVQRMLSSGRAYEHKGGATAGAKTRYKFWDS